MIEMDGHWSGKKCQPCAGQGVVMGDGEEVRCNDCGGTGDEWAKGPDPKELAKLLEGHADYRVLRRLRLGAWGVVPEGAATSEGLYLDTETTGLDDHDEIIEICMVPFTFDKVTGKIYQVRPAVTMQRQPSKPLPPLIVKLTGITDEMLVGKVFDMAVLNQLCQSTHLIIAHNAAFDRPFCERLDPIFAKKHWACSHAGIDWKAHGYESTKLSTLASDHGVFYDAHRAEADCYAGLYVLSQVMRNADRVAMADLLDKARKPSFRVWATHSPYATKEILKNRGYKWNDGTSGPKSWWLDVPADDVVAEQDWLAKEVYTGQGRGYALRLTALDRYSVRAMRLPPPPSPPPAPPG